MSEMGDNEAVGTVTLYDKKTNPNPLPIRLIWKDSRIDFGVWFKEVPLRSLGGSAQKQHVFLRNGNLQESYSLAYTYTTSGQIVRRLEEVVWQIVPRSEAGKQGVWFTTGKWRPWLGGRVSYRTFERDEEQLSMTHYRLRYD